MSAQRLRHLRPDVMEGVGLPVPSDAPVEGADVWCAHVPIVTYVLIVSNTRSNPIVTSVTAGQWGCVGCAIVTNVTAARLVPTGVAARELGITRTTLNRWWTDGLVKPTFVTAGGHARWDMDDLRRQLEEWRDSRED